MQLRSHNVAGVVQTTLNVLKSLPILSGVVRREVDKVLVCDFSLLL